MRWDGQLVLQAECEEHIVHSALRGVECVRRADLVAVLRVVELVEHDVEDVFALLVDVRFALLPLAILIDGSSTLDNNARPNGLGDLGGRGCRCVRRGRALIGGCGRRSGRRSGSSQGLKTGYKGCLLAIGRLTGRGQLLLELWDLHLVEVSHWVSCKGGEGR